MPYSLRSKVTGLVYKGMLSKEEGARIKEALLRQKSKKPIGKGKKGYTNNICPNCNYSVTLELGYGGLLDCDYCPVCGQAIDWSDVND